MSERKYIGARYIPIYEGTHNSTIAYDPLSVVDNGEGLRYISIKPVPVGVELDDDEFWLTFANGYILPKASSETLGGVKIGTNMTIDDDGVINPAIAGYGQLGVIKRGSGYSIATDGTLNINRGGGIEPDGSNLKVRIKDGLYLNTTDGHIYVKLGEGLEFDENKAIKVTGGSGGSLVATPPSLSIVGVGSTGSVTVTGNSGILTFTNSGPIEVNQTGNIFNVTSTGIGQGSVVVKDENSQNILYINVTCSSSGYQELEYVTTTSDNISTGIQPTTDMKAELQFYETNSIENPGNEYWLVYTEVSGGSIFIIGNTLRMGFGGDVISFNYVPGNKTKVTYSVKQQDGYSVCYYTDGTNSNTMTIQSGITCPVGHFRTSNLRVYSFKVWNSNDVLIADFKPVKRVEDNTEGLLNNVNGVFITV